MLIWDVFTPIFCCVIIFSENENFPSGVQIPECLTKFSAKRDGSSRISRNNAETAERSPLELAREQFEIAAKAKCDLGFRWLERLEEEEKRLLNP